MTTDGKARSHATVGQRLGHEMVQYALISLYLYVCFGALLLYKMAVLHAEGISYTPYGLAAAKALILGKFMLLGRAARVGDRYTDRRVIHVIAYKSLLFLLLLFVLAELEEVIAGVVHGRTLDAVVAEMTGSTMWQTAATILIMLLILLPYIAFGEISAALGEGGLRQLLLARRTAEAAAGQAQLPVG
jgi:hypothetical protein